MNILPGCAMAHSHHPLGKGQTLFLNSGIGWGAKMFSSPPHPGPLPRDPSAGSGQARGRGNNPRYHLAYCKRQVLLLALGMFQVPLNHTSFLMFSQPSLIESVGKLRLEDVVPSGRKQESTPLSFPCKRESSKTWVPAFAGTTGRLLVSKFSPS